MRRKDGPFHYTGFGAVFGGTAQLILAGLPHTIS
ncbi:unnamed protein product [Rhodiola kirilowii]